MLPATRGVHRVVGRANGRDLSVSEPNFADTDFVVARLWCVCVAHIDCSAYFLGGPPRGLSEVVFFDWFIQC